MMSEIELKPCPLCGGKAEIIQTDEPYPNWVIYCPECCISTTSCPSAKGLVESWNTMAERHTERHGVWNIDYDDIVCSECGTVFNLNDNDTENFNFCPNCGAKMREQITNYEKIKNMTVEEMVEFISCEGACNYCIYADDDDCKGLKCQEGVKAWLNQEVKEND